MITNLAIVLAVAMIESGNCTAAVNRAEQAYGWHQVRAAALHDVNRAMGTRVTLEHCLDPRVSSWVFLCYGRIYGAISPLDHASIWNAGPSGRAPRQYRARVRALWREYRKERS